MVNRGAVNEREAATLNRQAAERSDHLQGAYNSRALQPVEPALLKQAGHTAQSGQLQAAERGK